MKLNLEKLLLILNFLNEHYLFTTLLGFIIFLPFSIFILDGFRFSKNRIINIWQNCNIVFILFLLFIVLVNILSIDTIYNSDGSDDKKDPHAIIIENIYKAGKALGDKLGDGAAAAGGLAGMAKLIPKAAPIPVKIAGLGGGALAGEVGKRAGQAYSDIVFNSGKGSGSQTGNPTSNFNSSSNNNSFGTDGNNNNFGTDGNNNKYIGNNENSDLILDNSNLNDLDNSTLFNNLIYSENEGFVANLMALFNSDNKVEVLLSSILILNIIKIIMVLLLIISLCSNYFFNMGIELKWLVRFNLMSESLRSKIVNIINYVLKIFSKSIFLNVIILLSVILFCDIQGIYLLNLFINQLETMCDYYIKFKS